MHFLKNQNVFGVFFSVSLKYAKALRNNNSQNQNISKKNKKPTWTEIFGSRKRKSLGKTGCIVAVTDIKSMYTCN